MLCAFTVLSFRNTLSYAITPYKQQSSTVGGGGGGGIIILIKKLLIGRVRFKFQGCWVVFFSSIKFFIEHFEDTDQTSDLGLR